MIRFQDFVSLVKGKLVGTTRHEPITELVIDSRKAVNRKGSVFFCVDGPNHNGHQYIPHIYSLGIRLFVIEQDIEARLYPEASFVRVTSSIAALQKLVAAYRASFSFPIVAITGSNGKTIVKEWLNQLLSREYNIVKSPASFNSQIGVSLSVWQLRKHHQLGIFEAGISRPGEMERLEEMIRPTIGIFTTIGSAHDENFSDPESKIEEKLKLFRRAELLIYCKSHRMIDSVVRMTRLNTLAWGYDDECDVKISRNENYYDIQWKGNSSTLVLPFADEASTENAFHCVALLLYLGYDFAVIQQKIQSLVSIPMRLELKAGINHCQLIDDTYNNDLGGLKVSLDFLSNQHQKPARSLILSDILQSGLDDREMVRGIAAMINKYELASLVGIGSAISQNKDLFKVPTQTYKTTDQFLELHNMYSFANQLILVKGARAFQFERIVSRLQSKVHGTVMEVDLGALVHNLNYFRSRLKPSVKLMVMVKAFAYGSGNVEVANVLQFHKVDYLGVAYADEGVELRRNNISLPIMVMNPSIESFAVMMENSLEPEIYSFNLLNEFLVYLDGRPAKIHLKIDTGMHRLGFSPPEMERLLEILNQNRHLKVESVFSHLAGADDAAHDDYSARQIDLYNQCMIEIESSLGYRPIRHILNTSGIIRFADAQMDMVRLGIGLYGVDPTTERATLRQVATLKTFVSKVMEVSENETVGYGRKGIAKRPTRIATIAIGYADGFSRAFSNGVGRVLINGKLAPIIGNVCMDMTMVDVTEVEVKEGDEVVIFGTELPITDLASRIQTIPYEILTNTSDRVKRVFVAESI